MPGPLPHRAQLGSCRLKARTTRDAVSATPAPFPASDRTFAAHLRMMFLGGVSLLRRSDPVLVARADEAHAEAARKRATCASSSRGILARNRGGTVSVFSKTPRSGRGDNLYRGSKIFEKPPPKRPPALEAPRRSSGMVLAAFGGSVGILFRALRSRRRIASRFVFGLAPSGRHPTSPRPGPGWHRVAARTGNRIVRTTEGSMTSPEEPGLDSHPVPGTNWSIVCGATDSRVVGIVRISSSPRSLHRKSSITRAANSADRWRVGTMRTLRRPECCLPGWTARVSRIPGRDDWCFRT
jgi:hypothetical protein